MCQASDVLRASAAVEAQLTIGPVPAASANAGAGAERRAPRAELGMSSLVILGTGGGSNPKSTRSGFSNAVVVDDAAYIVDCGEGVHYQAWRAGISMHMQRRPPGGSTIRSICLTHLHSDHVVDLPNLLLGFWPTHPVDLYGPGEAGLPIPTYPPGRDFRLLFPEAPTPGVSGMVEHLFRAFAYNLNVRIADEDRADPVKNINIHEIGVSRAGYTPEIDLAVEASAASPSLAAPTMDPVVVRPQDEYGVTIKATLVQHAPVFPALGYRIDTPHGSVAFSGDTGPCDNVVRLAQGADVLVHEVIDVAFIARRVEKMPNRDAIVSHLRSSHTSPEEAARIAQRAGVKTLVMSHLVPGDDEFTESEWESRARPFFDGEIVCGVDLDRFNLSRC